MGARYDRIHVYYPRGARSGGPEALHQLVDSLRRQGQDAYLAPIAGTEDAERVAEYAHYDAPEAEVQDVAGAAVVLPEVWFTSLAVFEHATPFCWWLSIDNAPVFSADWQFRDPWRPVTRQTPPTESPLLDLALARRVHHLTQSHYAWSYLFTRLGTCGSMLSDHTDPAPYDALELPPPGDRGRTVAYNPVKADLVTEVLAGLLPDVTFVPLAGMTRPELAASLAHSAIYLDLGFHPGKDRMPREAALAGATVVVARRGAGAYHADTPLPAEHRLLPTEDMVERAADVVRAILADPDTHLALQKDYREQVRTEKDRFDEQVRRIFVEGRLGDDGSEPGGVVPAPATTRPDRSVGDLDEDASGRGPVGGGAVGTATVQFLHEQWRGRLAAAAVPPVSDNVTGLEAPADRLQRDLDRARTRLKRLRKVVRAQEAELTSLRTERQRRGGRAVLGRLARRR